VAFNSGSSALMGAYFAAGLKEGVKAALDPNTFIATAGAAMQLGASPLFIDIDRRTGKIDLEQLFLNMNREAISKKMVVAPVHFGGIPVDVQKIQRSVADLRTLLIEDACHALGSCYKDGSRVGSCQWSDMTVFSFHPAKTITTGEGGAVTTNDPQLYHQLQLFRNNGQERDPEFLQGAPAPWYYEVAALTGNFNFTEFQAALGLSQFKRISTFIAKRQRLLSLYQQELQIDHLTFLTPEKGTVVAPHLCVVQIDFAAYKKSRAWLMERLKEKGIGTQVHYIPLYRHPCLSKRMGELQEYFPAMETYYAQALSLPLYTDLSEEDVRLIAQEVKRLLRT
jgi:dTDP-4-amino-4,6-dideoxygalactose transaminase